MPLLKNVRLGGLMMLKERLNSRVSTRLTPDLKKTIIFLNSVSSASLW